ncbi:segregation/condensation protein A [Mycoplasma sp. ATU-Cv-508]|uniref:segregation/condensation protein A n=1 Tax=Mycoplasma sp. ATU-Cv-508 TaxID=2048001 RepID=UPI000FDD9642
MATLLKQREALGFKTLSKKTSDMSEFVKPSDPTRLDGQGNVIWLIRTVRQMYARLYAHNLRKTTISKFNWSAQEAQRRIYDLLSTQKSLTFTQIFRLPSLLHFAQTFLTILDLARKQEISLSQEKPYAPISLTKGGQND